MEEGEEKEKEKKKKRRNSWGRGFSQGLTCLAGCVIGHSC
jgi:hypothetical protein